MKKQKKTLAISLIGFFFVFVQMGFSQQEIVGKVLNEKDNTPVVGALIVSKKDLSKFHYSNAKGIFSYPADKNDTLIISHSYENYEKKIIPIDTSKDTLIVALRKVINLSSVELLGDKPISAIFSVSEFEPLDVYFNPLAKGDVLNAINILPSSTNTSESSNPVLRGSSPIRTRVTFNGVPIINPVRNTQLNNVGFFSLFNTQIMDKEYIYSDNPPLTYGNTTGGLVEITSVRKKEKRQLSVSLSPVGQGVFFTNPFGKKHFVQVYSNLQQSALFLKLNPLLSKQLKAFDSQDLGINLRLNFSENTFLNIYNYTINESTKYKLKLFNNKDEFGSNNLRNITIVNYSKKIIKGTIQINAGLDLSKTNYQFGNTLSKRKLQQVYISANYKILLPYGNTTQIGFSSNINKTEFKDKLPVLYYAQKQNNPTFSIDTILNKQFHEAYLFHKIQIHKKVSFGLGVRKNIKVSNQSSWWSYQGTLEYTPNHKHRFILAGGSYNSYGLPNTLNKKYVLLKSKHLSINHKIKKDNFSFSWAVYYKKDLGEDIEQYNQPNLIIQEPIRNTQTFGVETSFDMDLFKNVGLFLSNTYLSQYYEGNDKTYPTSNNLNFFIKTGISYSHQKIGTLQCSYILRPGTFYTPIIDSKYNAQNSVYMPKYGILNSSQYAKYQQLNFIGSKYITVSKKTSAVVYFNLSNIFDAKNISGYEYSDDYKNTSPMHFSRFTLFFGTTLNFN